jgi:hypothetical protein
MAINFIKLRQMPKPRPLQDTMATTGSPAPNDGKVKTEAYDGGAPSTDNANYGLSLPAPVQSKDMSKGRVRSKLARKLVGESTDKNKEAEEFKKDPYGWRSKESKERSPAQYKERHDRKHANEELVMEISKRVLGNYIKKAGQDVATKTWNASAMVHKQGNTKASDQELGRADKRQKNIDKATDRLTKEDLVVEISKKLLGNYIKKSVNDVEDKTDMVAYHRNKAAQAHAAGDENKTARHDKESDHYDDKMTKRKAGIAKATDRLTKEDVVTSLEDVSVLLEAAKANMKRAPAKAVNIPPQGGGVGATSLADSVQEELKVGDDEGEIKKVRGSNQDSKGKMPGVRRKYLGNSRGRTATGKPAHAIDISPTIGASVDKNKTTAPTRKTGKEEQQ